jgi:hypothetical protein
MDDLCIHNCEKDKDHPKGDHHPVSEGFPGNFIIHKFFKRTYGKDGSWKYTEKQDNEMV